MQEALARGTRLTPTTEQTDAAPATGTPHHHFAALVDWDALAVALASDVRRKA